MEEYSQRDLKMVATPEIRVGIDELPDSRRKIPVPPSILNTVRGATKEEGRSPEDVLCRLEEESGLSGFRVKVSQMADRVLGGEESAINPDDVSHAVYQGGQLMEMPLKTNPVKGNIRPRAFTMKDDEEA